MNNLKQKTVSGIVWSSIQRFGRMGVSFITNLILARLLSPEDYASMGILMVFITLANVFLDSGFGNALIQKQNPTKTDYSTIFFFNLFLAFLLYAILFVSAPAIARFYKLDTLSELLRVLSIILIINAFSLIQDNRMRKQLNFKLLTIISLIAAILGATCGIVCAYQGLGVWSLIIYTLSEAIFKTVLLWIFCNWLPSICFSFKSLTELFKYGSYLLFNSLLFVIRRNAVTMIMGKLYSKADVGYYSQAKKFEDVPVTGVQSIIGQVTFPVFSAINNDIALIVSVQKKSNMLIAFICIPLMIILCIVAKPLIILLLTEKWANVIPYFQILCFGGIFVAMQEVNANLINALGYSKQYFFWSVIKTIILIVLMFIGSFFGIYGLMIGYLIQEFSSYLINAILSGHYSEYTLKKQIGDLLPIFIIAIVAGLITWCTGLILPQQYWLILLIQIALFSVLYFGCFYIFKRDTLLLFLKNIKIKK